MPHRDFAACAVGQVILGQVPTQKTRLAVALLVAMAAALYIWRLAVLMPQYDTDFDPIRLGARLLLHGETPYQIGPGRPYSWNFPLLYPAKKAD